MKQKTEIKCPDCGNRLIKLEGKHKFAVQIDTHANEQDNSSHVLSCERGDKQNIPILGQSSNSSASSSCNFNLSKKIFCTEGREIYSEQEVIFAEKVKQAVQLLNKFIQQKKEFIEEDYPAMIDARALELFIKNLFGDKLNG